MKIYQLEGLDQDYVHDYIYEGSRYHEDTYIGQDTDWYLTCYKWNKTLERWDYEDFSICYLPKMVEVYHQIKNKVKQIDVLHYTSGENTAIERFFNACKKYSLKIV